MFSSIIADRFLKPRVVLIALGMLVIMAVTVFVGIMLVPVSQDVARLEEAVAYMRVPVLVLVESVVVLFFLVCGLSLIMLAYILMGRIYTKKSARIANVMSLCFFLMVLPLMALILYTRSQVKGSITNVYCVLGIAVSFVAGSIFGLFGSLIAQAAALKQEVDLTV